MPFYPNFAFIVIYNESGDSFGMDGGLWVVLSKALPPNLYRTQGLVFWIESKGLPRVGSSSFPMV
jgi:hypothetical protein